jgi:hypothetical protein
MLTNVSGAMRVARDEKDPLSGITVEDFTSEFTVNTISALVAAQEAVEGFKTLPPPASKTFIYTGNKLNVVAKPDVLSFGIGKSASAHLIESASIGYQSQGIK